MEQLLRWCSDNNLNLEKTKEMVDFRKHQLTTHLCSLTNSPGQYYLCNQKGTTTSLLPVVTKESQPTTNPHHHLAGCITVWLGNYKASECKALQRTVVKRIAGHSLPPSFQVCVHRATFIVKDHCSIFMLYVMFTVLVLWYLT